MSTRKTTLFYALLIAVASLAVGMVIASRLDLTPASSAQTIAVPPMNSAPVTGALDAPDVPQHRQGGHADGRQHPHRDEGEGAGPHGLLRRRRRRAADDLFRRFFGTPPGERRSATTSRRAAATAGGVSASRRRAPPAPASSSARTASSSPTTTSSRTRPRSKSRSTATSRTISYQAKVIGRDPLTDSALIQLIEKPNHPLPEAKFGDSSQMAAGDWVMAIGNPFGYAHTVTVGVISATRAAVPGHRRPHQRHAPDRRGDQPRQLGRAAAQPARRGDRHQHRDHHQRAQRGQHRHRLRRAEQHGPRSAAAAAHGQGHPRPHRRVGAGGAARRRSRTSA